MADEERYFCRACYAEIREHSEETYCPMCGKRIETCDDLLDVDELAACKRRDDEEYRKAIADGLIRESNNG